MTLNSIACQQAEDHAKVCGCASFYFRERIRSLEECLEQIILSAEQKESPTRAYHFIPDEVMFEAKSCLGKKL